MKRLMKSCMPVIVLGLMYVSPVGAETLASHLKSLGLGSIGSGSPVDGKNLFPENSCTFDRPSKKIADEKKEPSVFKASKDFDKESCLSKLPEEKKADKNLTSLGFCLARTIDGGKTKLEKPIEVEYPYINEMDKDVEHAKVKRSGCELGIDPDRFEDSDINCGSTPEKL